MTARIGPLDAETYSPLGAFPLVVLDLASPGAMEEARRFAEATQAIVLGVDRAGGCPAVDPAAFDVVLTTHADPPRPWVAVAPKRIDRTVAGLEAAVARAPAAAATLARVLRINEALGRRDAFAVESLAYSTLLGGAAFRDWRKRTPVIPRTESGAPFVTFARDGDHVTLTLVRPDTRNAIDAGMRDALFEALAAALDDPSRPALTLRGEGACFSAGGDLAEFGTATDLAQAHAIRTARSCAALLMELGDRAEARLHGACVGSGIEIPAAAGRRTAARGAFFQLPELAMGLIPGAGGTVTLPRAIGRHRTCWMALSGKRIPARVALAWGLVGAIERT